MKPVIALLCAAALLQAAEPAPYVLQWRDLPPLITGHKAALTLPDGTRVEGWVKAVREDGLRLDITRTSQRAAWPKGDALVPRAAVKAMRVTQSQGYTWRVASTAIGAGVGTMIGVPVALIGGRSASGWAAAAIAVPTLFGFLAGHSADRKIVDITVQ